MAVTFRVEPDHLELKLVGPVALDDVIANLDAGLQQPAVEAPVRLLIDVTASELVPDQDGLRRIATLISTDFASREGRVAVLVAEELRFGLARQIGAYLENHGIAARPFWERSAALSWLQSPTDS